MKNIIIGIAVVAVLIGGFFLLNNYIYQEKQGDAPKRETVSGTISVIDLTPMSYDGNGRITVQTESGEEKIIEVPARLNLCPAMPNIVDVTVLGVGDTVEVTGNLTAEGAVVPCESVEHYFHAKGVYANPALGFKFTYQKDKYVLTYPPHGNEEEADFEELYILMLKKDADMLPTLEGAEGPPTINVAIFRNTKNQDPSVWADANPSASNIKLATGKPTETVVSGANAVRYTVDGLYRIDTVVIADGGYIYVVSGAYLEENSAIRADFEPFLQSVSFI